MGWFSASDRPVIRPDKVPDSGRVFESYFCFLLFFTAEIVENAEVAISPSSFGLMKKERPGE
jgi:hypothetical protein